MFQDDVYTDVTKNPANWQIVNGMTVYATDGAKVGTVRDYDPTASWLAVHKGLVFTKDFYVPIDAVDTVTEEGVVLQLTKDDLDSDRFNTPPRAEGTTYNDVYAGTDSFAGVADKTLPENDQDDEIDRFDRVTTTGGALADQP